MNKSKTLVNIKNHKTEPLPLSYTCSEHEFERYNKTCASKEEATGNTPHLPERIVA